jgi:hypothetical protein
VLYEMLAGRPAYPELPTYEQFIIHLVSHPPDPLGLVAPWVPDALADVVTQSLQHDLHVRIPRCSELVRMLLETQSPATCAEAPARVPYGVDSARNGVDPARNDDRGHDTTSFEEDSSRTDVMDARPIFDGNDACVGILPVPLLAFEPPAPRRATTSLVVSGVRDAIAAKDSNYQGEAAQFFDRRSLPLSGLLRASEVAAEAASPLDGLPLPAVRPSAGSRPAFASLSPWGGAKGWVSLAVALLVVAVVVALALR